MKKFTALLAAMMALLMLFTACAKTPAEPVNTIEGAPMDLLGGLVTLVGLILAFYLLPAKAWAVENEDGTWMVYGRSRKGGALFRGAFEEVLQSQTKGETL